MALADQLKADMVAAMKAGEKEKLAAIRFISSEVLRAAKDAGLDVATDELAQEVLEREAKRRRDAISQARESGREDIAAETEAELQIIASYLPEQLGDDELRAIVAEVATEGAQLGAAIKEVGARTKGRADGARIAAMVREALGA